MIALTTMLILYEKPAKGQVRQDVGQFGIWFVALVLAKIY